MSELKRKELTMKIKKADAAISELEFKIEERMVDIGRIQDHIRLQKENKVKAEEELKKFNQ